MTEYKHRLDESFVESMNEVREPKKLLREFSDEELDELWAYGELLSMIVTAEKARRMCENSKNLQG